MADRKATAATDHASEPAFIANRLLATFPMELRQSLRDRIEIVRFETGDTVLRRGTDVDSSIFPFGPTMISMIVDLGEGRSVEVASIGREGAVGGIVSCGHAPAFARAEAIVGGPAARLPMHVIEDAKARSGHLRNLFCRYSDYLLAQIMQSAACNSFHTIEQRAARWLLTAQDRAGDRLAADAGGAGRAARRPAHLDQCRRAPVDRRRPDHDRARHHRGARPRQARSAGVRML